MDHLTVRFLLMIAFLGGLVDCMAGGRRQPLEFFLLLWLAEYEWEEDCLIGLIFSSDLGFAWLSLLS